MKKYLLITACLLFGFTMQSQVLISLLLGDKLNSGGLEFGLEGGYNFANVSGFESSSNLNNFNLGFYFDIKVKDNWWLYTGVLVKSDLGATKLSDADAERLGATISYDEPGDYSQRLKYFIVPAMAKYKFKNRMYVAGGPQFGWLHKAWIEYDAEYGGGEANIKQYNKSKVNIIDAGASIGAGYRFNEKVNGWTIGVRYYYGFVNVYKGVSGTNNESLFLQVNIPIGAGKAAKNAEEKKAKTEAESK